MQSVRRTTLGYAWLSFALSEGARYKLAASAARHALTLNPTNTYCLQQLGYCYERLNRFEDAFRAFRRVTAIDPKDGDAYFHCGINLFPLGRLAEATTNFAAAYALDRNNREARFLLFGCYLATMQPRKAYQLAPWVFVVGGWAATLPYLLALGFLLPLSFRVRAKPLAGIKFSASAWAWRKSDTHPRAFPRLWFSLAWLVFYVEGQLALFFIIATLMRGKTPELLLADAILPAIPVLLVGMLGFRRQPWGKPFAWPLPLGTRKTIWLALFGLALVESFNWAYSELVQLVTHHAPVQNTLPLIEPALHASPLLAFVTFVILLPSVEEMLFRGLLYGALERRLSAAGVITVTSLIFALSHFQIIFFIPIFVVGLLLGWARLKTGSIGLPILIHVLNNGLSLLMLMLGS